MTTLNQKMLAGVAKSYDVFISYRRDKRGVAVAALIKARLEKSGYRVFLDVEELRHGYFDKALLERIKCTKHFIVILTPNALERCYQKGDWLYREMKCALKNEKNIVPIMFADSDKGTPSPPKTDSLEAQKRNQIVYRRLQKLRQRQAYVCMSENLTQDLRRLPRYLPLSFFRNAERVCCSRWFSGALVGIGVIAAVALSAFYERRQERLLMEKEQLLMEKTFISVKSEIDAAAYLIREIETLNNDYILYSNEKGSPLENDRIEREYIELKIYFKNKSENKILGETTKKIDAERVDNSVNEYITKRDKLYKSLDDYFSKFEEGESLLISEIVEEAKEEYNALRQYYNDCEIDKPPLDFIYNHSIFKMQATLQNVSAVKEREMTRKIKEHLNEELLQKTIEKLQMEEEAQEMEFKHSD